MLRKVRALNIIYIYIYIFFFKFFFICIEIEKRKRLHWMKVKSPCFFFLAQYISRSTSIYRALYCGKIEIQTSHLYLYIYIYIYIYIYL